MKIFPWITTPPEPLAEAIRGVVIAEDNIEAGNKVTSMFSPPYDIREMERMVRIGPPISFTNDGVGIIEFMNCVPTYISPRMDEPYGPEIDRPYKISKNNDTFEWMKDL